MKKCKEIKIGKKLQSIRKMNGFTQEKLAESVGISANTVSYIERGKNSISFSKLPALCNALSIEPYQLFITPNKKENNKLNAINKLLEAANEKQINIIYNLISNILDF